MVPSSIRTGMRKWNSRMGQRSISRATNMHTQLTSMEWVALYMRVSWADR